MLCCEGRCRERPAIRGKSSEESPQKGDFSLAFNRTAGLGASMPTMETNMNKFLSDDHVLPRPVERLPEYAHGKARQALADRIIDAFDLSQSSATAIANAVVDPS